MQAMHELDRDAFFEVAYSHFRRSRGVGALSRGPRVLETLQRHFSPAVISNFDGRLRMILEQFGIAKVFRWIFISSEIGVDKPDPVIYRRALRLCGRGAQRGDYASATIPSVTGRAAAA